MKRFIFLSLAILAFTSVSVFAKEKVTAKIEGMHCEGCENSIKNELTKLGNVISAEVSVASKRAVVVLKEHSNFAEKKIKEAVAKAGYTVKEITKEVK